MPIAAPRVHWTVAGDRYHIAYTVSGGGSFDLVFMPNWFSNVEIIWENRSYAEFLERVASFARLILFDRRGVGLSDPLGLDEVPTLDERVDDLFAVLDAAGSERPVLMASGAGAYLATYVAAAQPERVTALVLIDASARLTRAADYPIGMPEDAVNRLLDVFPTFWGGINPLPGKGLRDPEFAARYRRQSAPIGRVRPETAFNHGVDVRPLLGAIHVPTLVVHHADNPQVRVTHGRFLANHIQDAHYVELEGDYYFWADDGNQILNEVEAFLTGVRRIKYDTVLATVLYTDIADSTAQSAHVGDRTWRRTIDRHDALVRMNLGRFGGREIKSLGDGFLVTFPGAQAAITCAGAIVSGAKDLDLHVRAGLHCGEIELLGDDVGGIAVALAARVTASAQPGEVLVTQTVKDLVLGAALAFEDRGEHHLKGVPGAWRLWRVRSPQLGGDI